MQKKLAFLLPILLLVQAQAAVSLGETPAWTIVIHPHDFVLGAALKQLHTRHAWVDGFDDQSGAFEVALRKKAVAIPAPQCRMDYLILAIPSYYPETPKQASVTERRAVYDALAAIQSSGVGSLTARVEAPETIARLGPNGAALSACNLYFALPLSVAASPQ
jgi:hypothetical protein